MTDNSSVILEALALKKPVISIKIDKDLDDDEFCNSNACVRTSIQDFESILSNILQDDHFRNLILQDGKTFLDENLANQGLASAKTIKFLDNL